MDKKKMCGKGLWVTRSVNEKTIGRHCESVKNYGTITNHASYGGGDQGGL